MDAAEQAYEAAKAEIARVKAAGIDKLDLVGAEYTELSELPDEVSELSALQLVFVNRTKIFDLSQLARLKNLRWLELADSQVRDLAPLSSLSELADLCLDSTLVDDLRPISALLKLGTLGPPGLTFENTPATDRDAKLAELSLIRDAEIRTTQTLAYLRSLPPWPEPYTPAATPDGSPPKPIGEMPQHPKITTAQTQIQHLIRDAPITRFTAQNFARHISEALQDVPATDGNRLAEPLQTMLEVADVLRNLAPENAPLSDPLDRAHLELRISQLEHLVDRLTRQLADETKARDAAEALAKKEGFIATHNQSFAAEAGKWNARLVYVGVPSAAVYFLGADNPLTAALARILGNAPR
jgi:hypothetical protein